MTGTDRQEAEQGPMYEGKFMRVHERWAHLTGQDPSLDLSPAISNDVLDRDETTFRLLAAVYAVAAVLLACGVCLWTYWNSHHDFLERFILNYVGTSIVLLPIVLLLSPLLPQLVLLITRALPDGPLCYIVLSIRQDGHVRTDVLTIWPDGSDHPDRTHHRTEDTDVCGTIRSWMRSHRDDLRVSTMSGAEGRWDTYLLRCRRRSTSWDLWQTLNRWRLDYETWHRDHERQKDAERQARIEAEEQRQRQAQRDALDRL